MEKELTREAPLNRCWLVTFCVASLASAFTLILGVTSLGPIDDHRFISTLFQGQSFGFYVMPELGRFIPLTSQEYVLLAKFFGLSPHLFHVLGGLKVVVCGVLLLQCLISTGARNWTAAILWSGTIFSIGFANAAIRLQIGELNVLLLSLVFINAVIADQKKKDLLLGPQTNIALYGSAALVIAFFYKELTFVFALGFGALECLRYYRQGRRPFPKSIWLLIGASVSYVIFYSLWRFANTTTSYINFHGNSFTEILGLYAENDPLLIFLLLPYTIFRGILFIRQPAKQTIYDSLLYAASGYVGAYLLLGIYNTYYLLPAYGFAVCGTAGSLATHSPPRLKALLVACAGLLGVNNIPSALSDAQALKAISNNHYQFVQFLSEYLWINSEPEFGPRKLVLKSVNPGSGIEIIASLKAFLKSFGTADSAYEIVTTEPSNNAAISAYFGVESKRGYVPAKGDLVLFNPYQNVTTPPPLLTPSYDQVYRSDNEWTSPRWTAWDWVTCTFIDRNCSLKAASEMRYTGYAALLTKHTPGPLQARAVESPSFQLGPLHIAAKMRAGSSSSLDTLISNSGQEAWAADGTTTSTAVVHISFVWLSADGHVALEGNRAILTETLGPGEKAKVKLIITTPTLPGNYRLVISPVQEGVKWFYTGTKAGTPVEIF